MKYTKQETNKNIIFPTGHWQNINHECITQLCMLSPFFYFFYLKNNNRLKYKVKNCIFFTCLFELSPQLLYEDKNLIYDGKSLWSATSFCMFQQRSRAVIVNAQINFTVITFIWDYDLSKGIA